MRADSAGHETETPMDDFVEIGCSRPSRPGRAARMARMARRTAAARRCICSVTIHSGRQTIVLPFRASLRVRASIPLRKLIDRERADNVVGMKPAGAAARVDPAASTR